MNWEDLDRYLVEIFHTRKKSQEIVQTKETIQRTIASKEFKEWINEFHDDFYNYTEEDKRFDRYNLNRMKCQFCKQKITDDKFVMIRDVQYPNDETRYLFFHSNIQCNPRYRYLKEVRDLWHFRYQLDKEKVQSKK